MKILLVEDNRELSADIVQLLVEKFFVVESAITVADAIEKLNSYKYNLVIVDIGLPDGSGMDVIKEIKSKRLNSGILILTARNSIADKVQGLDLGADDYITKPFHSAELIARVKAIVRRFAPDNNDVLQFEEIIVNMQNNSLKVNNRELVLTRKEFDLLVYFLFNVRRLLTKESIAEHLWGDHIDQADSFDFVYNHIKNLRKKLMNAGCRDYIKAKYGMGYIFGNNHEEK